MKPNPENVSQCSFWENPEPIDNDMSTAEAIQWITEDPRRAGLMLGFRAGQDPYPLADGVEPVEEFVYRIARRTDPELEKINIGILEGRRLAVLRLKGKQAHAESYKALENMWRTIKKASKGTPAPRLTRVR